MGEKIDSRPLFIESKGTAVHKRVGRGVKRVKKAKKKHITEKSGSPSAMAYP